MRSLLFLLLTCLSINVFATRVEFFKGDLAAVQQKAAVENKLYFIDFVANYCYLCKLMDETTFVNEELSRYIENNYIPYKVNVDDFDGYNLKVKYKIKVLPTILVFDSNGNLLARYEESMSAGKMMTELTRYDTEENRRGKASGSFASKPKPAAKPPKKPTTYSTNTTPKPTIKPDRTKPELESPARKEPTVAYAPPKPKSIQVVNEESSTTTEAAAEESSGKGLFEFKVSRHPSEGFGIQIGVFAEYSNVLTEVEKLEKQFNRPVLVNINTLNSKTVYKVIIGTFKTSREAVAYRNMMRQKNVDGVIADLSKLR